MSSTPEPSPDDDPWIGFEPQVSPRYVTVVIAAVTTIVLAGVAFLLPVPYALLEPGPVFNTLGDFDGEPMLSIEGDVASYPSEGTLDFTTVSVTSPDGEVTFAEAVRAYFDDEAELIPKDVLYPDDESAEEADAESAAQMASSQDSSTVAALRVLGYEVPQRVVVAEVSKDGAAAGQLKAEDTIRAVDGQPVTSAQQVVDLVSQRRPGDSVTLTYERDDATADVTLTTQAAEDDADVPRIGVSLGEDFDPPITVVNNVGDSVGGPSAGTMFALAIYDLLTPGPLTGDLRVAGTGEMAADGTVGAIGGIRQKMAGAHADDVEVFLVPADNCDEATDGTDFGMTLVKITTLTDAVASVETLAQDPDATVPSCP
ncbi:MAG: PDZ domain-containing protein [Aeromicrobium sp.]|uniref:YlbL family protein n=1 Tax=Aeromicrobium sp. TaxID=1871063 RepID=UPI0039E40A94